MKFYKAIILTLGLSLSACSSTMVTSYYDKATYRDPVKEVALGFIEVRNLDLNTFVKKNLHDSLKFELEKAKYKVNDSDTIAAARKASNIENEEMLTGPEIFRLSKTSSFDLYIQGYVQENKVGDALSEEAHTVIVLFLISRDGKKAGEIRHFSKKKTVVSAENLQEMVQGIVQEFRKAVPSN